MHTPEFAFEHVPANVAAQSAALGVGHPVAIDDDYGTWDAYANRYWHRRGGPASGESPVPDAYHTYTPPASVSRDTFALAGTWDVESESATAGTGAELRLDYEADDVYLVLGGTGTVASTGRAPTPITVTGAPTLYTLAKDTGGGRATSTISPTPGIQAYAVTFG